MTSQFKFLHGRRVTIDHVTGPFQSCRHCGHTVATISTEPVGMHYASLVCDGCGSVTSWLGRDHLVAIAAREKQNTGGNAGAEGPPRSRYTPNGRRPSAKIRGDAA